MPLNSGVGRHKQVKLLTESQRKRVCDLAVEIDRLLATESVCLGEADPPLRTGVYLLLHEGQVVYAGEAIGSKGLRDRLLSKHISGDDNHAIQRAFKPSFPNRAERREHIKRVVHAKWLVIEDKHRASAVERILIWLLGPPWNNK